MTTETDEYAEEVVTVTVSYLREVRDCVSLLPTALETYGTAEFDDTVERVCEREGDCDGTLRELRALFGEAAPPNFTDVYLQTGEVMRLYARLDAVPNAAERFVRELAVVEPDLSADVRTEFGAMATVTVAATSALADATESYVADLVGDGEADPLVDEIERVAALESDADGHRHAAIETAFETAETADALLVRDLARTLDAAADATEDAADHLLFMQGASV